MPPGARTARALRRAHEVDRLAGDPDRLGESGTQERLDALDELFEAAAWYESQQRGLARRFLDEIDALLPRLAAHPAAFARLPDAPPDLEIRRGLLHRFPYGVVFVELEEHIRVIAVEDTRRRPYYWQDRL